MCLYKVFHKHDLYVQCGFSGCYSVIKQKANSTVSYDIFIIQ